MNYTLYIFSIGSFLFILFAINLFFTKFGNRYLNRLFGMIMLTRGLQMLYYIFKDSTQIFLLSSLNNALFILIFSTPACVYLYLRGFVKDEYRMKIKDWLHFIPSLLSILYIITIEFTNTHSKSTLISVILDFKLFFAQHYLATIPNISLLLSSFLLLIYLIFSWRYSIGAKIIKIKKTRTEVESWILAVLVFFTFSNLNFFSMGILKLLFDEGGSKQLHASINIPLFTIMLSILIYFLFRNPKLLYGFILIKAGNVSEKNLNPVITSNTILNSESESDKKSINNSIPLALLDSEQMLKEQIINYMETHQPYLNPDFTIGMLSQEVKIPVHHCSYIINYSIKMKFRVWVNTYRINYFINEYTIHKKSKTILGVSAESGFKNKVTFYNSFLKEKGVLPTEYFDS